MGRRTRSGSASEALRSCPVPREQQTPTGARPQPDSAHVRVRQEPAAVHQGQGCRLQRIRYTRSRAQHRGVAARPRLAAAGRPSGCAQTTPSAPRAPRAACRAPQPIAGCASIAARTAASLPGRHRRTRELSRRGTATSDRRGAGGRGGGGAAPAVRREPGRQRQGRGALPRSAPPRAPSRARPHLPGSRGPGRGLGGPRGPPPFPPPPLRCRCPAAGG